MLNKQIPSLLIVLNLILVLNAWTPNEYTQACMSATGNPQYFEDASTKTVLDTQNILIGSAINYRTIPNQFVMGFTQDQYKYYIQKNPGDGGSFTTSLLIKKISIADGIELGDQTPLVISNNYQVVDADGSLALLKQTIGPSVFLTLNGLTDTGVVQIKSYDITSMVSNTRIIGIDYYYNPTLTDYIFAYIPFLNTDTKLLTVYAVRYNSGSLNFDTDTPYYTCTVQSITSAIYPNYNYALEIDGTTTMYVYHKSSQEPSVPFAKVSNFYDTSLYSNYYVIGFYYSFNVVFWSDDLKNAAWIHLQRNTGNAAIMLIQNQLKITNTNPNQLKIFHHSSMIMFVNIQTSTVNIFANSAVEQWKHFYQNAPGDQGNTEIINDFSNTLHLSYTFSASWDTGTYRFDGKYNFYLYNQVKIIKYILTTIEGGQDRTITWNKEYEVSIDSATKNLLAKQGESFEIHLNQKCMCSSTSVTSFTCFIQNDNCVFTVQTQKIQCYLPQE